MRKVLVVVVALGLLAPAVFAQDAFEDDDAAELASVIAVDAPAQVHTFHDAGDGDWAVFYAEAGTTKSIRTHNLGPNCDTVLTLVRPNGSTLGNDNASRGRKQAAVAMRPLFRSCSITG